MIRLGWNRARGLLASELQRLFRLSYGSLLHLMDLFPGEAVTGLEVERSVSGISCSQERRSPGWRRKGPSRGFLVPRRGAHRAGGGKIRLGPGNKSLLRRGGEFPTPRRGAHRAGGGKIRLGEFPIPRRGAHRAGGGKIRLGPGNKSLLRRGAHRAGGGKIRLGPGYKSLLRRGGHWAGGGKIRLGEFPIPELLPIGSRTGGLGVPNRPSRRTVFEAPEFRIDGRARSEPALSGSPIHAQRQRFCILLSFSSQRMDAAPCESTVPATKSIRDLTKALRLPRDSKLAKPPRGRANGHIAEPVRDRSGTVPGPLRTRPLTGVAAGVVRALSGSPSHAQRRRFCILLSPSSQRMHAAPCENTAPATKSILDLAKVLRLPRNSNLVKPARGRANGHIAGPVPGPFRDRSGTVPGPFRTRPRTGAAGVVRELSGSPIHAQRRRFCILLSPSSQRMDAAPCESTAIYT